MSITRAAKYLAAVDLGKTITVTDTDTDKTVTGELQSIEATDCSDIQLSIIAGKYSGRYHLEPDDVVTITGTLKKP
ncbi:hypothetical protein [Glutamicibacter sp. TV12E]|uniref:hypothetical protein n=1 Tax=Glutamicibacter sp. TV12E TaxID=3446362 RepID=UPI0040346540